MSIRERIIELGNDGHVEISVPPGRLAGFSVEGGSASFNNRGQTFAAGDRDLQDEELIAGRISIFGTPNARCRLYHRF